MKKDIIVIKVENNSFEINSINLFEFEEFEELFLSNLENKKKLKARKRKEEFNYLKFNEKEAKKLERIIKENEEPIIITTAKSMFIKTPTQSSVPLSVAESFINKTLNNKTPEIFEIATTPENKFYGEENITLNKQHENTDNCNDITPDNFYPLSPIILNKTAISSSNIKISSSSICSPSSSILKNSFNSNASSFKDKISVKSFKKSNSKTFRSSVLTTSSILNAEDDDDFNNDDDEKRELLFKFQILASKNSEIGKKYQFNMKSDLKIMKNTYNMLIKHLKVNNKVDTLNTYLIAGFMGIEYTFGRLGFDMEGFSKQQITSMNTYETLLTELGEKEYTPYGMDKWPVEMRLGGTIMFNALWFIVAKSISNKANFDIMGFLSSTKENNNISKPEQNSPIILQQSFRDPILMKRKMKGPE